MIHLGRIRLPATAWTPPFVLALVVAIVEFYLLVFMYLVGSVGERWHRYLWFRDFLTAGGALERGLPFEFMKINLFLGVYLWLMSRTPHPRREAIHRRGLLIAALVLVLMQILLFLSSDLGTADFTLIPIDLSTR